jgi:hypothetical protein
MIWMDIGRLIMAQSKACSFGVFISNELLDKGAKAQRKTIDWLYFLTGLFHPYGQGAFKGGEAQEGADIRAAYIFTAILCKIMINKHF